jgi:NAD(P)-dependent dehydrogenase (short-subunit alcohol dehydrogenase family)
MARALVTGASGYVGCRLVRELQARGESVGCFVRDPSRVSFEKAVMVHSGDMLDLMADALGLRRRPRIPVPLLTPWLSSHWIGLITPVDAGVARPLVEGLSTDTTVTDPSGMALFDFQPRPFAQALR